MKQEITHLQSFFSCTNVLPVLVSGLVVDKIVFTGDYDNILFSDTAYICTKYWRKWQRCWCSYISCGYQRVFGSFG